MKDIIEQIQHEKFELEMKISRLVVEFTNKTGVKVSRIESPSYYFHELAGREMPTLELASKIKVTLEI